MGCCESRLKPETNNDDLNQTRPINLNYISTKMNQLHEPKPNMQIKEKSLYKSTQDKSQISNNLIKLIRSTSDKFSPYLAINSLNLICPGFNS